MNDEKLIEIKELAKTYRQNGIVVHALDSINLTVQKGEFAAIVGPSGSGKTTLLNMIGILDTPSRGGIRLLQQSVAEMTSSEKAKFRRDRIGFIFQSFNLIPVLSVSENIEYVMQLQRIPARERKKRIESILEDLGLANMQKRLPRQLSGGEQQRVAIARAMLAEPSIILADEPTANIDSRTGENLIDLMYKLNKEKGTTFLFSTHDRMIKEHAKRVIQLRDGRIEYDEKQ